MKFAATTLSLLALASSTSAKFFLRTISDNDAFNAKCVFTYHTGAGTADAVLGDCGPAPEKSYSYDGHSISFDGYGKGIASGLQFYDNIVTYDSWGPVTIDTQPGTKGLSYSRATGFTQKDQGSLGFIVCHWAHNGTPQVFNLSYKNPKLPSSCSEVKLVRGCYNTDPKCKGGYF